MKILVTGAAGLIGSAVCARLAQESHTIIGAGRGEQPVMPPSVSAWVSLDFAKATKDDWLAHLVDVDVVVNCVGVLQDNPQEDTRAAHVAGPGALFAACAEAKIARVIHFSAIGVDRHQASAFSATKLKGDEALMALPLEWVILRPSVVLGPSAFGASAMFRGLAALPLLPLMSDTGDLQVVALEDVTDTVAFFVRPEAPSHVVLELAGPERLSLGDVVDTYRGWMGWRPARHLQMPRWASALVYKLGDAVSLLGWRPPVRSTARSEVAHGAVGNAQEWTEMTAIEPMRLTQSLAQRPAGVQERWFAKLYFVKPVLLVIIVLFWILTGIISLTTGFASGLSLMHRADAGMLAGPSVVAGALADIAVGLAIAYRPTAYYGLWAALGLSLIYLVVGSILLPDLWHEPLGPMLKIWPILAAQVVALAILKER